jgi:hypothetical protein
MKLFNRKALSSLQQVSAATARTGSLCACAYEVGCCSVPSLGDNAAANMMGYCVQVTKVSGGLCWT